MRLGLFIATLLVALAAVSSASAHKPIREVVPDQPDAVITDQCAFPVRAHIDGYEIHTTWTDGAGNDVKLLGVFPGNTLTLTNMDTGRAITRPATGSFQARFAADGSVVVKITGHGPWVPNPLTGELGIWYQSGQVSAEFDADGNELWARNTGTLVNLCPELAS